MIDEKTYPVDFQSARWSDQSGNAQTGVRAHRVYARVRMERPQRLLGRSCRRPRRSAGPTSNIVERPPTIVGTGFTNCFACRSAGSNGISIRW